MNSILDKLQPFLPVQAYGKRNEEEGNIEILDAETDEDIGSLSLDDDGELIGFSFWGEIEPGSLQKKDMASIADQFVDAFYPDQSEYELSAIVDFDDSYSVMYEKKDDEYGLFIHSTGFTISISTGGHITGFYREEEEYEVRYSDILVTEQEALETYMNELSFALNIQQFDREVYVNGDQRYHLAYNIMDHAMEIPVDGSEASIIIEEREMEAKLPKQNVPQEDLHKLIGMTSEYRLLDQQEEEGKRIEVWSREELIPSFSFDLDEPDDHVIKLCFDSRTNQLLQLSSGEEHDKEAEVIGQPKALERALQVLYKLYPDTHDRFRLETPEEADDEYEEDEEDFDLYEEEIDIEENDERYIETEQDYTFYFHLYHKGLRVDQTASYISVGKYTGKIIYMHLDIPSDSLFKDIPSTPVISLQDAKSIFRKYVQMKLMFVREYDDNGKSIYSLSYAPAFPDTVGHVRAIDAVTGEAMYVEVGDAAFF
ncbi:MAG: YcdB/YcdC domain-containing protein [Bacillus sp. (in: firmicutes)]